MYVATESWLTRFFLVANVDYLPEVKSCPNEVVQRGKGEERPSGRRRLNATGFLDTNVLANWAFIDASLRKAKADRTVLFDALPRYVPSYLLLERVRTEKRLQGILTTSQLAYAEILSVLVDQFVEEKMHSQGIAARLFQREEHTIQLSPRDVEDIVKQLVHLSNEFFGPVHPYISYVGDEYDFREFTKMRIIVRTETYDAILIATASYRKCRYFITEDVRLKDKIKNFNWVPMDVKVISVQEYLSILSQQTKVRRKSS